MIKWNKIAIIYALLLAIALFSYLGLVNSASAYMNFSLFNALIQLLLYSPFIGSALIGFYMSQKPKQSKYIWAPALAYIIYFVVVLVLFTGIFDNRQVGPGLAEGWSCKCTSDVDCSNCDMDAFCGCPDVTCPEVTGQPGIQAIVRYQCYDGIVVDSLSECREPAAVGVECVADVNLDGIVTYDDADLIEQGIFDICADVNKDGRVTTEDAMCIRAFADGDLETWNVCIGK